MIFRNILLTTAFLIAASVNSVALTSDECEAAYKKAINVVESGSLIDASSYPELEKVKVLSSLSKMINFQEAEADRANLAALLSSRLPAGDVQKMQRLGAAVREAEGDILLQKKRELELYDFILGRAGNTARYGNLKRYRDYISMFVNIDWVNLQNELAEQF